MVRESGIRAAAVAVTLPSGMDRTRQLDLKPDRALLMRIAHRSRTISSGLSRSGFSAHQRPDLYRVWIDVEAVLRGRCGINLAIENPDAGVTKSHADVPANSR